MRPPDWSWLSKHAAPSLPSTAFVGSISCPKMMTVMPKNAIRKQIRVLGKPMFENPPGNGSDALSYAGMIRSKIKIRRKAN